MASIPTPAATPMPAFAGTERLWGPLATSLVSTSDAAPDCDVLGPVAVVELNELGTDAALADVDCVALVRAAIHVLKAEATY